MKEKSYLLKLVESFLKDEYELEWVDAEIKIVDAEGTQKNVGRLYFDEVNFASIDELE